MEITISAWNAYKKRLSKIDTKALTEMAAYINKINGWYGHEKETLNFAFALATKYGEAAAAAACEFYDAVAQASGKHLPPAEPAETATYSETAKAVYGTVKNQSENALPNTVGRLVKQAGADTTLKNAARDGAQFAWVPSGDTCAFCIMLASNGWQYMGKKALRGGHAEHIHANCDCQYAIRFDSSTTVGGYDPDYYKQIYDNADGYNWEQKLRSMEHAHREEHKDEINARRREKYAESKRLPTHSRPEPLSLKYVNNKEQLYENLKNVKPLKHYEDVAIHGDEVEPIVKHETTNGVIKTYTASELADMIRDNPDYYGKKIRLLTCYAGAERNGFAQMLANELGKEVLAPTEKLWIAEHGEMFISDNDVLVDLWYNNGKINNNIKQSGYWKHFKPDEMR